MKFENSVYSKIWDSSEGRQIVTSILNDPNLIRANHTFWREKFLVDPMITPTNAEGEAVFTSRMRQLESGVLMDMRAPLGDSKPEDVKGMAAYQGTIQEFISKGTVEKATERYYKEKFFESLGDAELVGRYALDVLQPKIDSANQTLSYMSAYLLSHGNLAYMQGEGMQGNIYSAYIPAENFKNAGAKVWSDTSAPLFDIWRKLVTDANDKFGAKLNWILEVPRDMFDNVILKNEEVIKWIKDMYIVKSSQIAAGTNNLSGLVVNEENFFKYINEVQGIPTIVIAEEKQKDLHNGIVSGWKEGVAVLRPAGYAGLIRRTTIADVELFRDAFTNPANVYSFTPAMGGLAVVRNSTIVNGNLKEWHTDLVLAATPSLDEFLYHFIIDTTKAGA
jgi:hypothetical protein